MLNERSIVLLRKADLLKTGRVSHPKLFRRAGVALLRKDKLKTIIQSFPRFCCELWLGKQSDGEKEE